MKSGPLATVLTLTLGSIAYAPAASASSAAETAVTTVSECMSQVTADGQSHATRFVEARSTAEAMAKLDSLECGSGATQMMATPNYGPCTLNPGAIYLRASYGHNAAGNKPITTCTVPVSKITHANDIRYKWYTLWTKAGGTTMSYASNVARLEQKNVNKTCQGKTNTTFIGVTLCTIVYGGKTYYARAYTPSRVLACKM